jgi:hypothetical protein
MHEGLLLSRRSFLYASCGTFAVSVSLSSKLMAVEPIQPDHIILGCQDLDEGIACAEKLFGYRAAIGGSHPGKGTRNALLKMGRRSYLEILAPDPAQPQLNWHKEIVALDEPLLVGWAVPSRNLDHYAADLRSKGIACIGPTPGSRTKPNGEVLRWRTLVLEDDKQGILPFYIEWAEDSPHPSSDAPGACLFRSMYHTGQVIQTPAPGPDFHLRIMPNFPPAQLHVFIDGLFGEVELKSKAIPSEAWEKHQP